MVRKPGRARDIMPPQAIPPEPDPDSPKERRRRELAEQADKAQHSRQIESAIDRIQE